MSISSIFDRLHSKARKNNWLWLFSIFCRVSLAFGFFVAGFVKINDERFASGLHSNHPMGHFLEVLFQTGYYYTFIGVAQVAAAIFLLIPRTVTLGAFLYLPIILNITILTYATRFDGSLFTAPLMTLANLFLLGWNYEKWKYILPFNRLEISDDAIKNIGQTQESFNRQSGFSRYGLHALYLRLRAFLKQLFSDKFPFLFFAGVFAAMIICVIVIPQLYSVKPHNTYEKCMRQFKNTNRVEAGEKFCSCIHVNGKPLNGCLNDYFSTPDDVEQTP